MSAPSDEPHLADLWIRFKDGDARAFDELARLRYRLLFNYSTRFTKNRDFIKDCIQDLFLELWERRAHLAHTPYVTIYLIKALRNNLLRKLRNEKSFGQIIDEPEEFLADEATIEQHLITAELLTEQAETLRRAIDQLPSRQKEVIFLKFYEGMSNEEIAQIMEIGRPSVANFLYRALTQIKTLLPTLHLFFTLISCPELAD